MSNNYETLGQPRVFNLADDQYRAGRCVAYFGYVLNEPRRSPTTLVGSPLVAVDPRGPLVFCRGTRTCPRAVPAANGHIHAQAGEHRVGQGGGGHGRWINPTAVLYMPREAIRKHCVWCDLSRHPLRVAFHRRWSILGGRMADARFHGIDKRSLRKHDAWRFISFLMNDECVQHRVLQTYSP